MHARDPGDHSITLAVDPKGWREQRFAHQAVGCYGLQLEVMLHGQGWAAVLGCFVLHPWQVKAYAPVQYFV